MKHLFYAAICALLPLPAAPPAMAQTQDLYESVRNHITCYPFGIDEIGRGDNASGIAVWKGCFAEDYQFTINVSAGEPVVCPGEKCPFPKEMSSIEKRAAFARKAFDSSEFIRTSHHLTNVTILSADADRAEVKSYIQAWHLKKDGSSLIAPGIWEVSLAKRSGQWRIVKENLTIVFAGILQARAPARKE
jgi:hypothetical protein